VGILIQWISGLMDVDNNLGLVFAVYLIGAFIAGLCMCILNCVVNPMLNLLGGGGNSGNQLIQIGGVFNSTAAVACYILMGALIIILGLHQMEVFHFHFLEKQKSVDFGANKQKNELFSAFLLGLGFSFGWTPCIGPVLGSVLALAASDGQDVLMGAIYLLVYTLGMALPFLLLALASSLVLPYFNRLKPHLLLLKKIGGAIIILMGILLLLGQLNSLSSIFS